MKQPKTKPLLLLSLLLLILAECVSENVAFGKSATQISQYISPATAAVDGQLSTASCTDNAAYAWWSVDLGHEYYYIYYVNITSPDLAGYRQYPLQSVNVS